MNNKTYLGLLMGLVFLVTAMALAAAKMKLFGSGKAVDNWWAFFLLIPIGWFAIHAFRRWHEGARSKSRHLTRVALLIIPVFAASLYPSIWKTIYIPFIALLGVDMILGAFLFRQPQEKPKTKGENQPPGDTSKTD